LPRLRRPASLQYLGSRHSLSDPCLSTQPALFNSRAGGHCFQPIHIFEGNSGKPILPLLRPGKRPSGEEIARVLRHLIHRIRRHWPSVRILVRRDGHDRLGSRAGVLTGP
jgi:hypothetical protein